MTTIKARAMPATAARAAAKTTLRAFGMATSPLRRLPDFIIIGGKRCGTTSMYRYLSRHPLVAPLFPTAQKIKGAHFFDSNYGRGMAWYRSHFPTSIRTGAKDGGAAPVVGEASPYYLFHPHAARRARAHVPEAKLIVLLRNPVERAYSHYRERARHGVETLTFEEAIDREPERLAGEEERILGDESYYSFAHEHLSYVRQGEYVRSLERWVGLFPSHQFLFVLSEEFFAEPGRVLARVCDFLAIPPLALANFDRYNFHPGTPMAADTRARLLDHYAEPNVRLERLVDVDTSGWR